MSITLGAALALWFLASSATWAVPAEAQRVRKTGTRFYFVRNGRAGCGVRQSSSTVVESAIGQLSRYLEANHGARLAVAKPLSAKPEGDCLMAVSGDPPDCLARAGFKKQSVGPQGFVIRRLRVPGERGSMLVVWGETPLGCRYGIIELIRSLKGSGKDCYTEIDTAVDWPRFPVRIYYHNFCEHLQNAYSVNVLYDVAVNRWSRDMWRRYLEMIAAMRYTAFEFYVSPTFFRADAIGSGPDSIYDKYAQSMRWVIDQAHELGLQVIPILSINCTGPNWYCLCPNVPDERKQILDIWGFWTKKLSNADVFCIFPGDWGGCTRNGCTHETLIDLCVEMIDKTRKNGAFSFEINTWGPPFFDWGVPFLEGDTERAKAAFAYLKRRLPDLPKDTVLSINRRLNPTHSPPHDALTMGGSGRPYVDEFSKSHTVLTWDYYLSESEGSVMPIYRVPQILDARRNEASWPYSGGINYTMTPLLNVLTAFGASEAYWNPNTTTEQILADYSELAFGMHGVAEQVFPFIEMAAHPMQVNRSRMSDAKELLEHAPSLEVNKLFIAPDADTYRQSMLWFVDTYALLSKSAYQIEQVRGLTGKSTLSEVNAWMDGTPDGGNKALVRLLLKELVQVDPESLRQSYRSRVYGLYDAVHSSSLSQKGPAWVFGHIFDGCVPGFFAPFHLDFYDTPAQSQVR